MDAGCYDGGNPGIPGDITGTVGRVVVVGAGIAGLATAQRLRETGLAAASTQWTWRAGRSIWAGPGTIRFGEAVHKVALKPDGVSLSAESGVIGASHAVMTIPLGVLKQGRPRFRPPLPADRVQAMERLQL